MSESYLKSRNYNLMLTTGVAVKSNKSLKVLGDLHAISRCVKKLKLLRF